jgi:ribulose-5-phosphate 4-epimerase/fuculose-1-phosphate aldolase
MTEAIEAEKLLRRDLAACYRLIAHLGWDDLVLTHISARVRSEPDAFLLNPYGLMFEEITADSLVKVNLRGDILSGGPHSVNRAGFVIHSAIHASRADAHCVIHLHTPDGVAVSCLQEGLLPLHQGAIGVADDLAYHDYEGPATDIAERERLVRDLGGKHLMMLRNHGTLGVGATVPAAFLRMYALERACTAQVRALSMNRPLNLPCDQSVSRTLEIVNPSNLDKLAETIVWPALLRKLDRLGTKSAMPG